MIRDEDFDDFYKRFERMILDNEDVGDGMFAYYARKLLGFAKEKNRVVERAREALDDKNNALYTWLKASQNPPSEAQESLVRVAWSRKESAEKNLDAILRCR